MGADAGQAARRRGEHQHQAHLRTVVSNVVRDRVCWTSSGLH